VSGAASLPITNEKCTGVNVHWVYDTYALSVGTAPVAGEAGKKKWFFVTGTTLSAGAGARCLGVVVANGTVVGAVKHPFPSSDFSSFLLKRRHPALT